MKTTFSMLRTKGASMKAAIVAASLVAASQAHAEVPAWASTLLTELGDDVTAILALVGPVVMIAIGGFKVIGLIKRGAAKI